MAKPRRIGCWLPPEVLEIYLLTPYQKDRKPSLANPGSAAAFEKVLELADRWDHEAWVIMPDHIHVLVGPKSRAYRVSDWSHFVKISSQRLCPFFGGWQLGVFDHLLRSSDLGQGRWDYLKNNPLRSGPVKNWWEWPFFGGSLKPQALMVAAERDPTEAKSHQTQ